MVPGDLEIHPSVHSLHIGLMLGKKLHVYIYQKATTKIKSGIEMNTCPN